MLFNQEIGVLKDLKWKESELLKFFLDYLIYQH